MGGWQFVGDILIPAVAVVGAAIGAVFTLHTYYRNSRLRRVEWLYVLYGKFYEDSFYKKVRRLLDYSTADELDRLERVINDGSDPELCESLVDYLNFFEFVAGLWAMKQLTLGEVRMLFDYYIRLLGRCPFVRRFIETQGFESLSTMLRKIEASP